MKVQNVFSSDIHHVAIICSDFEVSKRFYHQILGFEFIREVFREDRKSWKLDLKVNAQTQLELFSFPSPPKRVSGPEACGLRHLAFHVDQIEETIAFLQGRGIATEPVRIDEVTGKKFTFFQDPDGLPIEIYER